MGRGTGKKSHPRGRVKHGREVGEQGRGKDEQGGGGGFQAPRGEKGKAQPGAGKEKGKQQPGADKDKDCRGKERQAGGNASFQATRAKKLEIATQFRKHLQHTFADVPKFTLHIHANIRALRKEIQRFIAKRSVRFGAVGATKCHKVPVTPPHYTKGDDQSDEANIRIDEVTYHILVFESVNGNLEVLIRENDGYVIAIRPQPKDGNQNDGWFFCKDVDLPVHLFGERNWRMKYDTGYKAQELVEMGEGCLDKLVEILLGFDEANYMKKDFKRERMLQTLNVFAGEAQRLPIILRFFLVNLGAKPWKPLGNILAFWTNHWDKLGRGVMHISIALLMKYLKEAAESDAELLEAYASLKAFKDEMGIPLTRNEFEGSTPVKFLGLKPAYLVDWKMHNQFMHGEIGKGNVPGADEDGDKLYLPLLIGYVTLIKFQNMMVPKLLLHEEEGLRRKKIEDDKKRARQMNVLGNTSHVH